MTYVTKQGDMFDSISKSELGDEKYTDLLIKANIDHRNVYKFPAGVELTIPEIEETETDDDLPPWKQVEG